MLNKPVVIYIITKLELGGAQKVCLNLLDGLQQDGQTAYLISGNEGTLLSEIKNKKNIIFLNSLKREVKNPFLEVKNFLKLVSILKNLKKKHANIIVHTHSTKAGFIGRWAALFAGIKRRIHTVHGFGFHEHQNFIFWLINYFLEFITSLITTNYICVSYNDQNIGKKLLPRFIHKSTVIRAAVNNQAFIAAHLDTQKLNFNETTFIFGTIACFKKQKNLFDLLKAFKELCKVNTNCKLEIIGDGSLRSAIESWIRDNKLKNKITLLGWQTEVAPVMLNWQAFVMSSLWEGLPCAIIEARLLKLPIISYDVGGIKEVVLNGKNGLLLKPKDWLGLTYAMLQLASSSIIQRNLSSFKEDLSPFYASNMIKMHQDFYNAN